MALGAIMTKRTLVLVNLLVARIAIPGRPFVHIVNMAGSTGCADVFSGKGEWHGMIKAYLPPAICSMALGTVTAKSTLVLVILLVAQVTILRCCF